MDKRDIGELLGEEIYLLWPDDGLWYPAEVTKVDIFAEKIALASHFADLYRAPKQPAAAATCSRLADNKA